MTFDAGLIFFISMLLMWIKPGPAQLLKIATTLDKGLPYGISFSFGSILMCSIFFVVAGLGYKALSDIFSYTGFVLQILGAIYLIYLSTRGFKKIYRNETAPNLTKANNAIQKKSGFFGSFTLGFFMAMTSPFWIFYFIGILPSLIPLDGLDVNSFLLGASLVLLSGIMVDWPLLTLISQLKRAFLGGNTGKNINLFINISFLLIAIFLLYSAFFGQNMAFEINDVL